MNPYDKYELDNQERDETKLYYSQIKQLNYYYKTYNQSRFGSTPEETRLYVDAIKDIGPSYLTLEDKNKLASLMFNSHEHSMKVLMSYDVVFDIYRDDRESINIMYVKFIRENNYYDLEELGERVPLGDIYQKVGNTLTNNGLITHIKQHNTMSKWLPLINIDRMSDKEINLLFKYIHFKLDYVKKIYDNYEQYREEYQLPPLMTYTVFRYLVKHMYHEYIYGTLNTKYSRGSNLGFSLQTTLFDTGKKRQTVRRIIDVNALFEMDGVVDYIEDQMQLYFEDNQYGIQRLLMDKSYKDKYYSLYVNLKPQYDYLMSKGLLDDKYLTDTIEPENRVKYDQRIRYYELLNTIKLPFNKES